MSSSLFLAVSFRAMMKNQGPSGEPWMQVDWIAGKCAAFAAAAGQSPAPWWGQGLDDVLQGVAVKPVPQVEEQHRHLGVREELGEKVALAQVFAHRKIVGEVAVVDPGDVERREGVGAARVPDAPPGGVALVGDPDVGLEVQELVV